MSGATDVVVSGSSGYVVPRTAEDVSAALASYFDDTRLMVAHGAAARNVAIRRYSIDTVLEQHRTLFDRILRGEDPAG